MPAIVLLRINVTAVVSNLGHNAVVRHENLRVMEPRSNQSVASTGGLAAAQTRVDVFLQSLDDEACDEL